MIELEDEEPGVYRFNPDGDLELIHVYDGGEYSMTDILEYFELGELIEGDDSPGLELDRKELVQLARMAQETRLDHPHEFIKMCADMIRAAKDLPGGAVRFFANF